MTTRHEVTASIEVDRTEVERGTPFLGDIEVSGVVTFDLAGDASVVLFDPLELSTSERAHAEAALLEVAERKENAAKECADLCRDFMTAANRVGGAA